MKTNESVLHKGMRTIVQAALRREASEPCITCWSYQPHRPEKPLPQPQDKKLTVTARSNTPSRPPHPVCGGPFLLRHEIFLSFFEKCIKS